jgi:hypothetical protein
MLGHMRTSDIAAARADVHQRPDPRADAEPGDGRDKNDDDRRPTSVRLAGRIAGKARKSPPISGPNRFAMKRVPAAMSPPKTNRIA